MATPVALRRAIEAVLRVCSAGKDTRQRARPPAAARVGGSSLSAPSDQRTAADILGAICPREREPQCDAAAYPENVTSTATVEEGAPTRQRGVSDRAGRSPAG